MRITVRDMREMLTFSTRNKDLIWQIILLKINANMDSELSEIFLFEFFLTEYSIVVENVIKPCEFETSLELALEYFEELEDYETCITVKKTLDKIKAK